MCRVLCIPQRLGKQWSLVYVLLRLQSWISCELPSTKREQTKITQRHCYLFTNYFIYAATIIIMSNDFWAIGCSGLNQGKVVLHSLLFPTTRLAVRHKLGLIWKNILPAVCLLDDWIKFYSSRLTEMRRIYVAGRGELFQTRSSVQLSGIKVRKTLERKVSIITTRRDSGLGLLCVAQAQDLEVEATHVMSAALTFHLNSFARWLTVEQRRILLWALVRTDDDIIPTRLSGKGLRSRMCKLNSFLSKWQNKFSFKKWIGSFRPPLNDAKYLHCNIIRSN